MEQRGNSDEQENSQEALLLTTDEAARLCGDRHADAMAVVPIRYLPSPDQDRTRPTCGGAVIGGLSWWQWIADGCPRTDRKGGGR